MSDENISIEIADKVSPSISNKLVKIAENARLADAAVQNLKSQLASLNTGALANIQAAASNATSAIQSTALASQRLATEQARTATAAAQAAAAQARVTTATTQGQTAAQNLATATTRANTAQTQGQTAAQRLATEQARTATQTANAAAASDRAALAALRLQQAQDRAAQSASRAGSSIMSFVRGAAAIAGVGLSAGAILGAADAYTVLQNKLQNVSESEAQVNQLTERLFDVANRTRTPVQETAQAFTRFDMALKNLGKSQEDSLKLTETVNKMLTVSGATSNEAGSALLQLSQAFNKGKLDGDEFRSVMELMPNAADAIAKRLGVTRGELLKLAPQGKITAKVMFEAFRDAAAGIDAKFGKTVPTLSQAFTVLKNNATKSLGELNKELGITAGLSSGIIALANNMKALGVVSAVVGAALLVYFGPTLLAGIAAATRAVIAFTVAIASNPIGALIVGITAAAAAIYAYGDSVSVTADKAVTLKDMFRTAFEYIKDAAGVVTEYAKAAWNTAIDWINEKTNGWGEQFRNVGDVILSILKTVSNFIIGYWAGVFAAVKTIWDKFPDVMQFVFASVVNAGATAVETLMNLWQIGLRKIADLGKEIAPDMAARLSSALDSATIKLPRMEVSQSAKDAASEVAKSFTDAFKKDYVGNAATAFMERARKVSAKRRAEEAAANANALRGTGKAAPDPIDEKAAKAAAHRALMIAVLNKKLDDQTSRVMMLKDAQEQQAEVDKLNEQLMQKKLQQLNPQEEAQIKSKVAALQEATRVGSAMNAIYEEVTGPQRDYTANLTAAQKLLSQGSISQEQYSRAVTKATEAFQNAKDPMRQYNKDLQQQFELAQMLPKQREVEQQIMQVSNDLLQKGIKLSETETQALREKLKALQAVNAVSQQEASLMDASVSKRQQFIDQMTAIKNLRANEKSGFTAGDQSNAVSSMISGMGLDTSNLQVQSSAYVSQYQTMFEQINQLRAQDLINEQDAAALRMQIWAKQQESQLNTASTFFGQLAQMSKSENKKLAAIGKAAAIAQAMIQTYSAATSAYAAMASIPYVGPALGAAAAAAAVVAGLANVQAIRSQSTGFKDGGYTGSIGVNEVAGVVHGREFVMDAQSTARIGVDNLQALQNGAASIQGSSANPSNVGTASAGNVDQPAPQVTVNSPVSAVVVSSKEQALSALRSTEGRAFIIETLEENSNTIARIAGVR